LLYCPIPRQPALRALLALRSEINASLRASLDHQVAHTRLAWWQEECLRASQGAAVHPMMREFSAATRAHAKVWPDLRGWIRAVALDLAKAPLDTSTERSEYADAASGTLCVALAQLLGATPEATGVVRQIGRQLGLVELLAARQESIALHSEYALLQQSVFRLPVALQPQLRAMLVWVAVAASDADEQLRTAPGQFSLSLRQAFAQNMLAWRSARAAARQTFRLRALRGIH
jgi:Squalene/phytoene synthase